MYVFTVATFIFVVVFLLWLINNFILYKPTKPTKSVGAIIDNASVGKTKPAVSVYEYDGPVKHNSATIDNFRKFILITIALLIAAILYLYFFGGHDLTYHNSNISAMMYEGQSLGNLIALLLIIMLLCIGLLIVTFFYKLVFNSK